MKILYLRIGMALATAFLGPALAVPVMADVEGSVGWLHAMGPGAKEAAGYLVLTNNGDEERKLLRITSAASDEVGLRRSIVSEEGLARAWPVGFMKLAPGESLHLEPEGLQVMFSNLKSSLKAGDKVPLTLQFDGFEKPFTVMLEVRPLLSSTNPT